MRTFLGRAAGVLAGLVLAGTPWSISPADAASTYLLATRVVDGTVLPLRWNPCQDAVTYRVNPRLAASTAAGRAAAVADVRGAFTRLGKATGITFRYLGTTSLVPTGPTWSEQLGDAEIVVAWVDQRSTRTTLLGRSGAGYVAGTGGYSYKTWTWPAGSPHAAIGRGYVVLNSADNSAFRSGFGAGTTRGQLLLHELGHVVGLRHVGASSQLMYPVLLPRGDSAYRSGDLTGLRKVGRAAGCVDVPDWVWTDL
ncbi:MAG: hypothetical protein U0S36_09350 [Candidatus Nanopelagicales bacterium]